MDRAYRPAMISTILLLVIALLSIIAYYGTISTRVLVKKPYYEEKLQAAQLMQSCLKALKDYRLSRGLVIDLVNDPNETGLIGEQHTLIRTDVGSLDAKLTTLNPNFAAAIVDMLKSLKVKEGDLVAISVTGSMPGANIAVLCAVETLKLKPVMITSVGASTWGATDPYFTWLDMETVLKEKGLVNFGSLAASIGGGSDIGRRLSPRGRELIIEAIKRNKVEYISANNLTESIEKRLKIYESARDGKSYKAFINIGGGAAAVGHPINLRLFEAGITRSLKVDTFEDLGVLIKYAKAGVPIIHILNIPRIAKKYDLPIAPVPLPEPGEGKIFADFRYNLKLAAITFCLLFIVNALVMYRVFKKVKFVAYNTFEEEDI